MISKPFSARQNYQPEDKPITIREDAPRELREAILILAKDLEMSLHDMLDVICDVLLVSPDPQNWMPSYAKEEVNDRMNKAPWYKVYDIAESYYAKFVSDNSEAAIEFERRLNDFFLEEGIGWELRNGKIIYRGSEVFAYSTHNIPQALKKVGFQLAANEMREALSDISRHPNPDITGAIQHAMAALETTAREVAGDRKQRLGQLSSRLNLPSPLDEVIKKLWGYASNRGRHIREGQNIDYAEAELVVTIAGSLCGFFAQRKSEKTGVRSLAEKASDVPAPQKNTVQRRSGF